MKSLFSDGTLTIDVEGRISSANADEVYQKIKSIADQHQPLSLVLNAGKLEYISSAGLRGVLKLKKEFKDLSVIDVSTDVYEIFDMTGFTEIVTIERAYREFDVTGCEIIGEGANGVVYRASPEIIVKVYRDFVALDDIKRERDLSRTAFVLGIPTAIPYDIVKVGNSYGTVFELLNAKSLAEILREDENNLEYVAQESCALMKIIHGSDAPEQLPMQRDTAMHWVGEVTDYFTAEQHKKLSSLIGNIPETGKIIHGDLHIKNMMSMRGETLLIDMDTLCTGHPIYELAFIFNAYKGFGVADENVVGKFLQISPATAYRLLRRTLSLYLGTEDEAVLDEVEEKASVIGYLRVMRRVIRLGDESTEEGRKQVAACHDKIEKLIEKYDTLTF